MLYTYYLHILHHLQAIKKIFAMSVYVCIYLSPFHVIFLRVIRQARPSATRVIRQARPSATGPSYYTRGALKTGGGCRAGREIYFCVE